MLIKIILSILVAALVWFALRWQEKNKSTLIAFVAGLNLHQGRALNDQAVGAFCNRLGRGQSDIAALIQAIGVTREHIASLEGRKETAAAITKPFFEDAKRVYQTTRDEAALRQGLQSYIYNEPVSPEEIGEMKDILRKMEAAF